MNYEIRLALIEYIPLFVLTTTRVLCKFVNMEMEEAVLEY